MSIAIDNRNEVSDAVLRDNSAEYLQSFTIALL